MTASKGTPWRAVLDEAVASDKTQADVAREQRVSRVAVCRACQRYSVTLRNGNVREPEHPERDEAFHDAVIAGISAARFCRGQGLKYSQLAILENRHGMRLPRLAETKGRAL